ncbi:MULTISPECIES: hypothetical protein [unclassified Actinotalea]|uniref:hypothetical protein n=1 Tax=unclassified Actinotalea TaxID=2638618 RepID=UPI0015F50543|nr:MULTISPECIES: hypothetical protein [unclassified Actinotalea]
MRHPGLGQAAVLSAGTVLALLLSACSTPAGGTGTAEGGPVAYVTPSSDGGDSALLEGTVQVSDSCVVIADEFGQTWLPIFQRPRTTWDGTTLTYNRRPYTDGSSISLGGGFNEEPLDADYAPNGATSTASSTSRPDAQRRHRASLPRGAVEPTWTC